MCQKRDRIDCQLRHMYGRAEHGVTQYMPTLQNYFIRETQNKIVLLYKWKVPSLCRLCSFYGWAGCGKNPLHKRMQEEQGFLEKTCAQTETDHLFPTLNKCFSFSSRRKITTFVRFFCQKQRLLSLVHFNSERGLS